MKIIDLQGSTINPRLRGLQHLDSVALQNGKGYFWSTKEKTRGYVFANADDVNYSESFTLHFERNNNARYVAAGTSHNARLRQYSINTGDIVSLRSWEGRFVAVDSAEEWLPLRPVGARDSLSTKFMYFPSAASVVRGCRAKIGTRAGRQRYECFVFVREAYDLPSGVGGSAKAVSELARRKGLLKPVGSGEIPYGAWVFFDWRNDGHVGIKTDGDQMIHLLTTVSNHKIVEDSIIRRDMQLVGWVCYEDIAKLYGYGF